MAKFFQSAKKNVSEANKEVIVQTAAMINGAFALIAALAWNEAVKALIDRYFPAESGLSLRFIYAIIITILLVLITRYLNTIARALNQDLATNDTQTK